MVKFSKPGSRPAQSAPAKKRSKYADVSGAKVFGQRGSYIRPGRIIAMIERVEEGTTADSTDFVSVHLIPLVVDDANLSLLDKRFGGGLNRVGEAASDFNKLSGNIAFASNMMAFAMAASNMTQDEIREAEEYDGQFIEEVVGEEQPFAGVVVEIQATIKKKKVAKETPDEEVQSDDVFTKISYLRRVPFAELPELVDEGVLAAFIPDLDEKIAAEAGESEESDGEAE